MKSKQNILAVEASTNYWSITFFDGEEVKSSRIGNKNVPLSEALLPSINEVLAESGKEILDVDLLAVSTGPGSFTGLRVGIAVCQGIALSRGIAFVGISYLEILANAVNANGLLRVFVLIQGDKIYFQDFYKLGQFVEKKSEIKTQDFSRFFGDFGNLIFVSDSETIAKIGFKKTTEDSSKILTIKNQNLSAVLGLISKTKILKENIKLSPIYF